MSYDTKCYELADAFLQDVAERNTETMRSELAQRIQDVVEDFMDAIPESK